MELTALVSFAQFLRDANLILRILVFLSIVVFVRRYLGTSRMATFITAIFSFIALFVVWPYVAGAWLFWVIMAMGLTGPIIDSIWISKEWMPSQQMGVEEMSVKRSGIDKQRFRR